MFRHALFLAAGCVAGYAQASTHTVSSNITTPILLSGNFNGGFDVRPFLGSNTHITQASILLSFADDVEQYRLVTLPSAGFVKTGVENYVTQQFAGISYTTRQVEMLQTIQRQLTDITGESVTVNLPGESRSAGTQGNAGNLLVDHKTSRTFVRSNCLDYLIFGTASLCTLQEVFYTDTITDYYGKTGAFDIQFDPIGAQALADLNRDGLLDFNGSLNSGDTRLMSAQMRFDLVSTAQDNGTVPEPALPALLGIGALALYLHRRQR